MENKEYQELISLFETEFKEIGDISEELIQDLMQSDGNHESETSLRNHEKVKELEANLNFFIEHKLLKHAEKLNERLKENLEQMDLKYQLIRYTKDQNQQEELINKTLIYLVNKR